MRLSDAPLLTADQIRDRVTELAREISDDYAGRELTLVAVLKGAVFFVSDLARSLTVPTAIGFIRARSYAGTRPGGEVEFTYLPEQPLTDKHVLVVEDILDTGSTARAILERIEGDRPASLALCTLLDKPSRREVEMSADYVGFTIDDHFVVGYGLDYNESYRELPGIHVLHQE